MCRVPLYSIVWAHALSHSLQPIAINHVLRKAVMWQLQEWQWIMGPPTQKSFDINFSSMQTWFSAPFHSHGTRQTKLVTSYVTLTWTLFKSHNHSSHTFLALFGLLLNFSCTNCLGILHFSFDVEKQDKIKQTVAVLGVLGKREKKNAVQRYYVMAYCLSTDH